MAQKITFQHGKLGKLREARGVTQQELADAIKPDVKKISRELIKDFEIGSRIPKIDVVVAFAKYFGVSTDYLFGLTETPTRDTDIRMISDYTGLSENVIQMLHERYKNSQGTELGYLHRAHATNEMLWEFTRLESFCLTLSLPITQKAKRLAANDIAKQIIENPKRLVAKRKKANTILHEINECISRHTSAKKNPTEEALKINDETSYKWLLEDIVEILERNIPFHGNDEFDRFEATQQYIEAYDRVMKKYPEDDLVEEGKSFLLDGIGLRFVEDELDSDK